MSVPARQADYLARWADGLRTLRERALLSQDAFLDAAGSFDHGRLPAKSDYPPFLPFERDEIKKKKNDLCDFFRLADREALSEQFRTTGRIIDSIRVFLEDLDARYSASKRERGLLDFDDVEHMFLSLLERDGEETEVCRTLRKRFREIYIDEYQDVSPLQDRIFTLLSNGENRFMVGDVKQSIYRFRNAYPDIFLAYKDRFPPVGPENGGPEGKVFLRENFRSARTVLDFTNLLFSTLTDGTAFEREYKGEELVFARGTDDEKAEPVTVARFPYESRRSIPDGPTAQDATTAEAEYIADQIAERMRTSEWKERDGTVRPCRYSDFALLFLVLKDKTAPYEEALRKRGIPFRVSRERLFFDQPEIQLALDLLRCVDDPSDDISLFGTMRSPLFGFSAEDVYRIRTAAPGGPLIQSIRVFIEPVDASDETGALRKKAADFIHELEEYRLKAEDQPCHAFLWELFAQTGLLYLCGNEGLAHLLMLYENARVFEQTGYKGLSGFLAYLRVAEEKRIPLPAGSEATEEDCVTLTTIHKSKGLEYPVVFLCGSGQLLKKTSRRSKMEILREEGLFFPVRDARTRIQTNTLTYLYSLEREKESEYGETLRKLYVGCTRAREKLYITGIQSFKEIEEDNWSRLNPKSILEMVSYAISQSPDEASFEWTVIRPETASAKPAEGPEPVPGKTDAEEAGMTEEVRQALDFEYKHRSDYAASLTASELKLRDNQLVSEYKRSQLIRDPAFLPETGMSPEETAAYAGTANHAFLQYCDYVRVETDGMEAEADRLIRERRLSPEQARMLDYDGLDAFFRSPLYRRIRRSRRVEREKMFAVRIGADFIGVEGNETILLKGLMDLVFEEEDGIVIVDYKTDRIRSSRLLARNYRLQMRCYRRAVEEMTGRRVKETLLWSFALDRAVAVDPDASD